MEDVSDGGCLRRRMSPVKEASLQAASPGYYGFGRRRKRQAHLMRSESTSNGVQTLGKRGPGIL